MGSPSLKTFARPISEDEYLKGVSLHKVNELYNELNEIHGGNPQILEISIEKEEIDASTKSSGRIKDVFLHYLVVMKVRYNE